MSKVQQINPASFGVSGLLYSQATVANGFVFLAGQGAVDENYKVIAPGDAYLQGKKIIERIRIILAEVGAGLEHIVSATVFFGSLDDSTGFNRAWVEEFGDHRPARAAVVGQMVLEGMVAEVIATAVLP
ncbi:RidA family protein [Streptomyces malaysiensis]|uniref:RidA family protein n=1 Tax=Streptomyces malaysiensis subsp. samsunensis TaxID=459658 RepID=A0A9X2LXD3_STRMQ|nr:RidA family protein [Streptomyces samsunensis]MCQ8831279.1 RidA family protein [Streptomyces samsunensis]WPB90715.1 RidA family protein [Streptomyces malaysiensis]